MRGILRVASCFGILVTSVVCGCGRSRSIEEGVRSAIAYMDSQRCRDGFKELVGAGHVHYVFMDGDPQSVIFPLVSVNKGMLESKEGVPEASYVLTRFFTKGRAVLVESIVSDGHCVSSTVHLLELGKGSEWRLIWAGRRIDGDESEYEKELLP